MEKFEEYKILGATKTDIFKTKILKFYILNFTFE